MYFGLEEVFMKLKMMLVTLAAASLSVSVAVAAPEKGKPLTTGAGCKPKVTVVLKGTLAATPGPSGTTLSVNAKSGNRFAREYLAAPQPLAIAVGENMKVRHQGKKTLGDLLLGDRVHVQARACKAELLAEGAPPALTAVRVVGHAAAA